jgi:hypothetical protein
MRQVASGSTAGALRWVVCGVLGVIGRMFLAECIYSRVVVHVYR